jgi:hypothetical protein
MKALLDLPDTHKLALNRLLEKVPSREVFWALTGSAGLRLQGVDVPVHDLDVQSDQAGVAEIARRLPDCLREAPRLKKSELLRSYYGLLEVSGVKVELMGDIQRRLPGGWEEPVELERYRRWVVWRGKLVPVLDLEYEAQTYARLGREVKAAAIRAALANWEGGGYA